MLKLFCLCNTVLLNSGQNCKISPNDERREITKNWFKYVKTEFILSGIDQSDQSDEGLTVSIGSSAELNCGSKLTPPVAYTWSKLNSLSIPIGSKVRGSTLILSEVTNQDAGIYVCSANNSKTSEKVQTVLRISGIIPRFMQNPVSFIELEGDAEK